MSRGQRHLESSITKTNGQTRRKALREAERKNKGKKEPTKYDSEDGNDTDGAKPALRKQRTVENSQPVRDDLLQTNDFIEGGAVQISDAQDEFSAFFRGEEKPMVFITTTIYPGPVTSDLAKELADVFPGAKHLPRLPQYKTVESVIKEALPLGYTHMILVNEQDRPKGNRKPSPDGLTIVKLPEGPTAYFKLSSITLTAQIYGHGRATPHSPELILNNFNTRLGHSIGRLFVSLFPPVPQFHGRQAVTVHNQRDFIFFRRHRYIFDDQGKRCDLQELGPRFTLKLEALQRGLMNRRGNDTDFELAFKASSDSGRTKTFLL